jgi:hypothetical protein
VRQPSNTSHSSVASALPSASAFAIRSPSTFETEQTWTRGIFFAWSNSGVPHTGVMIILWRCLPADMQIMPSAPALAAASALFGEGSLPTSAILPRTSLPAKSFSSPIPTATISARAPPLGVDRPKATPTAGSSKLLPSAWIVSLVDRG